MSKEDAVKAILTAAILLGEDEDEEEEEDPFFVHDTE